jgi:very-short-patch-repair endonuclease
MDIFGRGGEKLVEVKIKFARVLRKKMTEAEVKLWQGLRRKQIKGFRFRKQVPMGKYILDFVCYEGRLIAELDGGQHSEALEYDEKRTKWLESQGYQVRRFWNHEVLQDLDVVMEVIFDLLSCQKNPPSHPSPARGAGARRLRGEKY